MTAWFTTYDPTSGEIIGQMHIDEELLDVNTLPGFATTPGQVDTAEFFIASGVVTAYTPQQKIDKAVKPSHWHRWNNDSMSWMDTRSMAQVWEGVKLERSARLSATDWVVVKAQETGTAIPAAWLEYRQALRDITSQTDPLNINWPSLP
jgi:hypothetical protein